MRLLVAAVGKLKDEPERAMWGRYADRIKAAGRGVALGPLTLVELPESRAARVDERKDDEAQRLLSATKDADFRIVLDERGKSLDSRGFAKALLAARDGGSACATFLIGGADGHGAAVKSDARLTLSLSALTLPHGLARVLLAEQIYRAVTIATGHPYHRD